MARTAAPRGTMPRPTRLMNLIFFLKERPGGATAAEIRSRVAGYDSAKSDDAFNRQFRRDRTALAEMSLPVERMDNPGGGDPLYVLRLEQARQAELRLAPKDLALLAICARNALESPGFMMREELTSAVAKLPVDPQSGGLPAAGGGAAFAPEGDGVQEVPDRAILDAVNAARAGGQALEFEYETATGARELRRAVPVAVFSYLGSPYLYAYDCRREAVRSFRFSRFQSAPQPAPATPAQLAEARGHARDEFVLLPFQLGDGCHDGVALLAPAAAGRLSSLAGGRGTVEEADGRILWHVAVADADRFARWCIENGPGIVPLRPTNAGDAASRLASFIEKLEGGGADGAQ